MYIVGTAGHIDHGKTSLITALNDPLNPPKGDLTKNNCDRLPEEKKRGMTIDVGFSNIDYPDIGTVSIIDVPGHERFIRNMVVGAWGMDLALLVIAADDGWMPQTEDHFRVLNLLNIEKLIVVINKSDLVNSEQINNIKNVIIEKLKNTRFSNSVSIEVSATNGLNIQKLKDLIHQQIKEIEQVTNADKPYLFIDRVFSPKGAGTVVTGTLKNGFFNDGEQITILPHERDVKIKKIESHYKSLNTSSISQRTALNLTNISASELKRGDIVVKKSFFSKTNELIAEVNIIDNNKKIKNNMELEILIGTTTVKGKMILLENEIPKNRNKILARIKFANNNFAYPNEPFIITNPGGHSVIGGGRVIITNYKKEDRKKYFIVLSNINDLSLENIILANIKLLNVTKKENFIKSYKESNEQINSIIKSFTETQEITETENYICSTKYYSELINKIISIYHKNNKISISELASSINLNIELVKEITQSNTKTKKLFNKKEIQISMDQKILLKKILENKNIGIETNKEKDKKTKNDIKELLNLKLLVSLDGNIYYHKEIYDNLCKEILSFIESNEKLAISDAREITGLSRKYIIPLLNRMERDFLIKHQGDFRVKI